MASPTGWSIGSFWKRMKAPLNARIATPAIDRYRKYHRDTSHAPAGVGWLAGCCVTINLLMGSGFLALPRAFVNAGILLSSLVLVLLYLVMNVTVMYEVEVMYRAEAVMQLKLRGSGQRVMRKSLKPNGRANGVSVSPKLVRGRQNGIAATEMGYGSFTSSAASSGRSSRTPSSSPAPGSAGAYSPDMPMFKLSRHAYQMTEMCQLFGGRAMEIAYSLALGAYLTCTLWGYGSVFALAMAAYIPISLHSVSPLLDQSDDYLLWVGLFSFVVVPLSCMEIREQVPFQMFMTVLRALIIILMACSALHAFLFDASEFGPTPPASTLPLFRFEGFLDVVMAVLFAFMLNSSTPVIVESLQSKEHIVGIVPFALLITLFSYSFVSYPTAFVFKQSVHSSCNVNWAHYSGLGSASRFVSLFVVLFPALDVLSVFPLNVQVLASNLMAAVYGDRIDKASSNRLIVTVFRLGCALPPIFLAAFLSNLTQIVDYAGSLAVIVSMVIPAVLNYCSIRECARLFPHASTDTPVTTWRSSRLALAICAGSGMTLFLWAIGEEAWNGITSLAHMLGMK